MESVNYDNNKNLSEVYDRIAFCLFHCEWKEKENRFTKPPLSVATGYLCDINKEENLGNYKAARSAYQKYLARDGIGKGIASSGCRIDGLGIGIVLGNGIGGIDIDHCIDMETGEISEAAIDILEIIPQTYTEFSPSGTGLHLLFYYGSDVPKLMPSKHDSVEIYVNNNTARYFTLSGRPYNNVPLATVPLSAIEEVTRKYGIYETAEEHERDSKKKPKELAPVQGEPSSSVSVVSTKKKRGAALSDAEVIEKFKEKDSECYNLYRGIMSTDDHSSADLSLCNRLLYWCDGDSVQADRIFRSSALMRDKWDERRGAETYGERTLNKALADYKQTDFTTKRRMTASESDSAAPELLPSVDSESFPLTRAELLGRIRTIKPFDKENTPENTIDEIYLSSVFAKCIRSQFKCIREDKKTSWYWYDGTVWTHNDAIINETAKDFSIALRCHYHEWESTQKDARRDVNKPLIKLVYSYGTLAARKRLIEDSSSVNGIAVKREDFDKDTTLFNLANGTYDLEKMEFRKHSPKDMLTKKANGSYNPELLKSDELAQWEKYLKEITVSMTDEGDFVDDDEKFNFIKLMSGYLLSPTNSEEVFFVLWGKDMRNGKSTLCESMMNALGSYGDSVEPSVFTTPAIPHSGQRPQPEIAKLKGTLYLRCSELPKGMNFNTQKVKSFTGGDTHTARFLHSNTEVKFIPTAKLVIDTNHLPQFSGKDIDIFKSNRIIIVTFDRHFSEEEQDHTLKTKFKAQQFTDAILTWIITAYIHYKNEGFNVPESIRKNATEQMINFDTISRFINDHYSRTPNDKKAIIRADEVYSLYCITPGTQNIGKKEFLSSLRARGIVSATGTIDGKTVKNVLKGYTPKA